MLEDLDGYWEYLTHPAHVHSEMSGMELIDRFEAFDVTDSDDPEIGDKIATLQARNYEEHPELAELVAVVARAMQEAHRRGIVHRAMAALPSNSLTEAMTRVASKVTPGATDVNTYVPGLSTGSMEPRG